jgi:retron-type reverse transcriptase
MRNKIKSQEALAFEEELLNFFNTPHETYVYEKTSLGYRWRYRIVATPFTQWQLHRLIHPFIKDKDTRYREFKIPKKKRGYRTINAPSPQLKSVQKHLKWVLNRYYRPTDYAHGFIRGRSIVTNAEPHLRKRRVFNTDISDFFTSITLPQIVGCLTGKGIGLDHDVAMAIGKLCCMARKESDGKIKYYLPQGAPTSPMISNIVCRGMDIAIAKEFGRDYSYTRYADDITISTNKLVEADDILPRLKRILAHYHFKINASKTRMCKRTCRQEVTGIIVNKHLNLDKAYIREVRQLLYIWENYGYEDAERSLAKHRKTDKTPHLYDVLMGKLLYLKMVIGIGKTYSLYKTISHLPASFLKYPRIRMFCKLFIKYRDLFFRPHSEMYYDIQKMKYKIRHMVSYGPLENQRLMVDTQTGAYDVVTLGDEEQKFVDRKAVPLNKFMLKIENGYKFDNLFLYKLLTIGMPDDEPPMPEELQLLDYEPERR